MYLFYDTETSGLPDFKKPENDASQPHIIQAACILLDDNGVELERMNEFVLPDGWVLKKEITDITGITHEHLVEHGKPIAQVVDQFVTIWRKSKLRVAHNDSFDAFLFRLELARLYGLCPMLDEWKQFPKFCTMHETTALVKCPPTEKMMRAGFNKFKNPRLEETYQFLFGRKPEKQHDALADVESTVDIFVELKQLRK